MPFVLAGLVVISIIFLYAGVPLVHREVLRFVLKRKATKSQSLVLTFDDIRETASTLNRGETMNIVVMPLSRE